jgi:hypothetical protein
VEGGGRRAEGGGVGNPQGTTRVGTFLGVSLGIWILGFGYLGQVVVLSS